jgi:hypothetical protein
MPYIVRLYRPRPEILNGTWEFLEARPQSKTEPRGDQRPEASGFVHLSPANREKSRSVV